MAIVPNFIPCPHLIVYFHVLLADECKMTEVALHGSVGDVVSLVAAQLAQHLELFVADAAHELLGTGRFEDVTRVRQSSVFIPTS